MTLLGIFLGGVVCKLLGYGLISFDVTIKLFITALMCNFIVKNLNQWRKYYQNPTHALCPVVRLDQRFTTFLACDPSKQSNVYFWSFDRCFILYVHALWTVGQRVILTGKFLSCCSHPQNGERVLLPLPETPKQHREVCKQQEAIMNLSKTSSISLYCKSTLYWFIGKKYYYMT